MHSDKLFPDTHDGSSQEEPWDHRFQPLAKMLGCSIDEAASSFYSLEFPEYTTRSHLDATRDSVRRLNKTLGPAKKLLEALKGLSNEQREFLYDNGTITVRQLEHLSRVLSGEADWLQGWYSKQDRKHGRNVAVHTVAEGVRRAFRRQRSKITYGEMNGEPSTLFGQAIKETIAAFGVRADWAEPAHKAWQKQKGFEARLGMFEAHLTRQKNVALRYPEIDWSKFVARYSRNWAPANHVAIMLRENPSAEPLVLPTGHFLAGKEPLRSQLISWVKLQVI